MRYALTGATGFVGGALARRLRETGHDVTALVRNRTAATPLAAAGVELVQGDLADSAALDDLCGDADGLFHVAGWYKVGDRHPEDAYRVNVKGTENVLAAAARSGVRRVVHTSTLAVNSDTHGEPVDETYRFTGSHLSVYDATKAAAHDLVQQAAANGRPVVTVMPGAVYGPGDTSPIGALIDQTRHGRRPLVPHGGRLCWAHIDDVVRGHTLAMDEGEGGEAYMLAGPPASLAEALRLVASITGTPGPIVVPDAVIRLTGGASSLVGRVVPAAAGLAESARAALATYLGDSTKARERLGWTCRDLATGLAETVA